MNARTLKHKNNYENVKKIFRKLYMRIHYIHFMVKRHLAFLILDVLSSIWTNTCKIIIELQKYKEYVRPHIFQRGFDREKN